jgi:hypothetical protein
MSAGASAQDSYRDRLPVARWTEAVTMTSSVCTTHPGDGHELGAGPQVLESHCGVRQGLRVSQGPHGWGHTEH